MGSLGDFGTPRDAYEESFGYFGKTIRVNPDLSDLSLIDFALMGSSIDEETKGTEAIGMVDRMIRDAIHAEDFDTFWSTAKANRQTIDDLTDLMTALVEAVTDRPTEQPSGSSDGQPSTPANSEGDSYSQVKHRLEAQGRPDLALMVLQAEEFRASA